ncbi:phage holin family protein [Mycoplasmatota bacterium]|nr:phage holin family protein [Mycoplasmatota bacterium]
MNDNNELKKSNEKEKEYEDLFEAFLKSDNETTFSKSEVEKILEAHIFKEVLGNYQQKKRNTRKKSLLVTSKEVGLKIFNSRTIVNFLISYLFYIGFLLIINEIIYPNLFINKPTVFIIAFGFTIIDKFVKPFIFVADLVSFTMHRIGLITIAIYAIIFYFVSYFLDEKISIGRSIIIVLIVLLCIALIDYLKSDSLFKTKYINDIGSDDDE